AGILVLTDASLGNVTKKGNVGDKPLKRVFFQTVLQRVCRSTFAAELLGMEEGLDAGQYCRGHVAETLGCKLGHKNVESILDLGLLSRCNVGLKWTATENRFVDCSTKDMDSSHMRETLAKFAWSLRRNLEFVKQTVKGRVATKAGPEVLSGAEVKADDPVLGFLQGLPTQKGWHRREALAIQVSHGTKRFRRPEPRFHDPYGKGVWRILERDQPYGRTFEKSGQSGSSTHHGLQVL
ncbi:unnamed protein product, partial [Symbiodinium necroappetens]